MIDVLQGGTPQLTACENVRNFMCVTDCVRTRKRFIEEIRVSFHLGRSLSLGCGTAARKGDSVLVGAGCTKAQKIEHRKDDYFCQRNSEKMGRMLATGIEFYVLRTEQ